MHCQVRIEVGGKDSNASFWEVFWTGKRKNHGVEGVVRGKLVTHKLCGCISDEALP